MNEKQRKPEREEAEVDPFTRMMFGGPSRREVTEKPAENRSEKVSDDYEALKEQVDSIMDSVNKLKPMLKDFSPLLEYFKK
ncbi:hypothetical protein AB685_13355 [Bacillus sp. LL01]|uniref:hypothetical protein n=1 Tax=Bacillus sp. LL01 TaxID=1665556 RepID=UPI00064D3E2E|nr:hypothetical protein [Bacillus sp. LL01]KMJ57826.1 hypothetical protein AB685_13355 [Bacillus sp. LL01]